MKAFIYDDSKQAQRQRSPVCWAGLLSKLSPIIGRHENLPFPNSSDYVELMESSRLALHQYFLCAKLNDQLLETYLRKYYDLKFLDYYAFRYSIKKNYRDESPKTFQRDQLLNYIYNNDLDALEIGKLTRLYVYFCLFLSFTFLCLFHVRNFIFCILSSRKKIGSVVYLRKKAYPDQGLKGQLKERLRVLGIKLTGVFILYSSKPGKFGFYYLNALENSILRSNLAFMKTFSTLLKASLVLFAPCISWRLRAQFIKDLYIAHTVTLLPARAITGVTVDKPIFSILKILSPGTQVYGINESFFYPPFRSFDYNNLDVYYAQHKYDAELQNKFGGNINSVVFVPFFRGRSRSESEGISPALALKRGFFDFCTVFTTMQISHNGYTQWGVPELLNFVQLLIDLSSENKNHLFILKGKKGELNSLPQEMQVRVRSSRNIFVIDSVKPRYLKFDQFEDLLGISDLVVSMSHTSTTIWQAIASGLPFIAINDAHAPSFLTQFKHFECKSRECLLSYKYWSGLTKKETEVAITEIGAYANVNTGDGIDLIASDLGIRIK